VSGQHRVVDWQSQGVIGREAEGLGERAMASAMHVPASRRDCGRRATDKDVAVHFGGLV